MGYELQPVNKKLENFRFGAFSFPILLEACGYLFPCICNGGQWYCAFGVDQRMGEGGSAAMPRLITNDGFKVSGEESKIMSRIARNYVIIQRTLPDENKNDSIKSKESFNKEEMVNMLAGALGGVDVLNKFPIKIREDFTDKFEKFAEWADKSDGFEIW